MNLNQFLGVKRTGSELILPSAPGEIKSNSEQYQYKFGSNKYQKQNDIERLPFCEKEFDHNKFGTKIQHDRNVNINDPFSRTKHMDISTSRFDMNFDRSMFGTEIDKSSYHA